MMEAANCIAVAAAILAYVYYRLEATNMIVPDGAERVISRREAIRFAVENNLPM